MNVALDLDHLVLDLDCANLVSESEATRSDHLVRRELHRAGARRAGAGRRARHPRRDGHIRRPRPRQALEGPGAWGDAGAGSRIGRSGRGLHDPPQTETRSARRRGAPTAGRSRIRYRPTPLGTSGLRPRGPRPVRREWVATGPTVDGKVVLREGVRAGASVVAHGLAALVEAARDSLTRRGFLNPEGMRGRR